MNHISSFGYHPHFCIKGNEEWRQIHLLHTPYSLTLLFLFLFKLVNKPSSYLLGSNLLLRVCSFIPIWYLIYVDLLSWAWHVVCSYSISIVFNLWCIIHVFRLGLLHLPIPFPRIPGRYNDLTCIFHLAALVGLSPSSTTMCQAQLGSRKWLSLTRGFTLKINWKMKYLPMAERGNRANWYKMSHYVLIIPRGWVDDKYR